MKEVVAIIVGGGPAPGINGVISAAAIEAITEGWKVIGLKGGFKSLFNGERKAAVPLEMDDVSWIHSTGGSILKTSRDYPERAKAQFKTLMSVLGELRVRNLITVGGDGTLFMARWIEKEARGSISVVHVPKTIDNDIPLPGGAPTFGFETARHVGVRLVGNLMEDARTTGRWYLVKTMGRCTGHLALGIGKASGATLTIVPEEFPEERISLRKVADIIEGSIIKRLAAGKKYGLAVMAEGLSGKLDLKDISPKDCIERDESGNVRLSEIHIARVLKGIVAEGLKKRGINLTIIDKDIGYELRAAPPIPYDSEYTRNLGYGAMRFLIQGGTGSMIVFYEGRLKAVPFVELFDQSTGKTRLRYVDVNSESYMVARNYMIRLEKEDFKAEAVKRLSQAGRMSQEEFKKRFSHLVK